MLRLCLAGRTPRRVIERVDIFLERALDFGQRLPVDRLRPFLKTLFVSI